MLSGRAWGRAVALGLIAAVLFAAMAWRLSDRDRTRLQSISSHEPARLSSIIDVSGAPVATEAFRGKVLVLNLWAAWCVPCIKEMPSLDRLAGRLPPERFAVIAVNEDSGGGDVARRTFEALALHHLALYLDPAGRLKTEIGARGMPTTLILGADGIPLSFREGATVWDSDEMVAYLLALSPAGRRAARLDRSVKDSR
jgi:thiol-disulfide isomerase/thioredoxin